MFAEGHEVPAKEICEHDSDCIFWKPVTNLWVTSQLKKWFGHPVNPASSSAPHAAYTGELQKV